MGTETEQLSLGKQNFQNKWVLKDSDRIWPWPEEGLITPRGGRRLVGTRSPEEVQS